MKRSILIIMVMSCVFLTFGQGPDVTNCFIYLNTKDYEEAKASIDKASVDKKAAKSTRCWLCYGLVYKSISDSCIFNKSEKYCELAKDALTKAYDGFLNAWILNFKNPEYKNININDSTGLNQFINAIVKTDTKYSDMEYQINIILGIGGLTNSYINIGLENFKSGNYSESVSNFEKALFLSQIKLVFDDNKEPDTELIYLAALAYEKNKDYNRAGGLYKILKEINYGKTIDEKAKIYIFEAKTHLADGDTSKYFEILEKGLTVFPSQKDILSEMINYCIFSGKLEKAKENLLISLKTEPSNKLLHYNLGYVYEKLGDNENAVKYYKSALEIDRNYFDAAYNLGAIFFNKAVEKNDQCEEIPPSKTKEYEECKKQAEAGFKEALPHLENAYNIDPKDKHTLSNLKTLYAWFKDTVNYEKIKKELEELDKK